MNPRGRRVKHRCWIERVDAGMLSLEINLQKSHRMVFSLAYQIEYCLSVLFLNRNGECVAGGPSVKVSGLHMPCWLQVTGECVASGLSVKILGALNGTRRS